jgi:aldehyde dehydrogenase (NAD+)
MRIMTDVSEIFATLAYGPAPESDGEVREWLGANGPFGHVIDGRAVAGQTFETRNPATGAVLAEVAQGTAADVDRAVRAARRAQPKWAALSGHQRARHLYALARAVQKNARALAVLETLDTGKPIRESRDIDLPLVARHFYYHAGMAQLMAEELPDREALGVCGQIIPWNFPLLMLAWKVAPALAMGNTVVLKPAEQTPLTALMFAELARAAGLPKGVLNIVTGDGDTGAALVAHAGVDKIAFTGSTPVGRAIREATAGTGKALTLELGGKSPYIVFDDADIDSAIEGLVDAIWFNGGQVCCAGARLLVHEAIAEDFHTRLKTRMDGLRVGDPLDKCIDVGALIAPSECARVAALVAGSGGEVYQSRAPEGGAFYPPTLITGLHPADPLMQEEIFGPVLVSTTFRTPVEAVQLANNTRYGLAASLWTENVHLALDLAPKLEAGIIWINATNLMDAAAGFGGMKESGFGREGGWGGLRAYTRPKGAARKLKPLVLATGDGALSDPLDRTPKLYVGGKQARPDGGYVRRVFGPKGAALGEVAEANRKDIRNAVEAARAAGTWGRTSGHLRAQILYYMAENLSARAGEFAARLTAQTGRDGAGEVEAALERLFTCAAWADKYEGRAVGVPIRGIALGMPAPVGVIGAFASEETPLLGLVTVIGATMAMGNRLVLVAPEGAPLCATDLYQVLDTSDVPGGVVNILTGGHADLAPHLAGHMDVDACWSFSSADISGVIERAAAGNLKRTWVNHGRAHDFGASQMDLFLEAATEVKTIWVPYGE